MDGRSACTIAWTELIEEEFRSQNSGVRINGRFRPAMLIVAPLNFQFSGGIKPTYSFATYTENIAEF